MWYDTILKIMTKFMYSGYYASNAELLHRTNSKNGCKECWNGCCEIYSLVHSFAKLKIDSFYRIENENLLRQVRNITK